jgi:hypothetical protein
MAFFYQGFYDSKLWGVENFKIKLEIKFERNLIKKKKIQPNIQNPR